MNPYKLGSYMRLRLNSKIAYGEQPSLMLQSGAVGGDLACIGLISPAEIMSPTRGMSSC
jgi:hypothetical protein